MESGIQFFEMQYDIKFLELPSNRSNEWGAAWMTAWHKLHTETPLTVVAAGQTDAPTLPVSISESGEIKIEPPLLARIPDEPPPPAYYSRPAVTAEQRRAVMLAKTKKLMK